MLKIRWRSLSAVAWLLLCTVSVWQALPSADAAPPQVLMIAVDDLNDWVGCLGGHPQVQTPNIDRLASRGVLFRNAHCQAPLCNPSRTSVLLGLRPSTTGVYSLTPSFRDDSQLRDRVTLLQAFQLAGYHVVIGGKIFHDAYPIPKQRTPGNEVSQWGFQGGFGPFPPTKLVKGVDPITAMDWGAFPERDEDQDDYRLATWAAQQLAVPVHTTAFDWRWLSQTARPLLRIPIVARSLSIGHTATARCS